MDKVVIISSNRPTNYIHRIFNSIGEDIKIHLFIGSENSDYVDKYISWPNVSMTKVVCESSDVLLNQFLNYQNALTNGYVENDEGILIFEDDIKFAKGWLARFHQSVSNLKSQCSNNFALTLFTSTTVCKNSEMPANHYTLFPDLNAFWGTQGMYYPNSVREKILKYFSTVSHSNIINYDILVRQALIKENIPLYVCIPCLIDHVGFNSTWSNNQFTMTATIFHPTL